MGGERGNLLTAYFFSVTGLHLPAPLAMRRLYCALPVLLLSAALFALPASLFAQPGKDPAAKALEREILKQLIEINTSDSAGHTPEAAKAMADRLLAVLSPEDQQALLMIDGENASIKEVAEATGWSESKVKVRAFRARRKVREAMEKLLSHKSKRADSTAD